MKNVTRMTGASSQIAVRVKGLGLKPGFIKNRKIQSLVLHEDKHTCT